MTMPTKIPGPVLIQPNQFQLSGYDTEITYAGTSFAGVAELTYKTRGQTVHFRGENIKTERTQLGQQVTVTLLNDPLALGPVESLTLLLPAIGVPTDTKESPILTLAILSLRLPGGNGQGQAQQYMALPLSGTASQLDF